MLLDAGFVTRRQAVAAGLSERTIDELLRGREWTSVHQGVLAAATDLSRVDRNRTALATQAVAGQLPDGVALCRTTAAAIHGFVGVPEAAWVDVAVPRVWMPKHRPTGVRLHRCWMPPCHVVQVDGLPVTSAAWTALTLARVFTREDALVAVDAALRTGRCTPAELRAGLPSLRGLRGVVQARDVVELAREGVDSPQETRLRMTVLDGRLPMPDVNMRIEEDGRLLARGELGYWSRLIWLEYDGYDVHIRRGVFRRDRARQNWLAGRGWYVLRYVDTDLYDGRRRLQYELRLALQRAPARIAALPPGRSPEADAARTLLHR